MSNSTKSSTSFFERFTPQYTSQEDMVIRPSFGNSKKKGEKTFEENFEALRTKYKDPVRGSGIDIRFDYSDMVKNKSFMEQYKKDLLTPIYDAFSEASENDPHIESLIDNTDRFWDNKMRLYATESASIAGYLPIGTLEFPVLAKQFWTSVSKDIIDIETTKTPHIEKQIKTIYVVDNNTGAEYEYPACLFDATWREAFDAGRGHEIRDEVVPLTNGKLYKYDIISNLTNGVPGLDKITLMFRISKIQVGGEIIRLPGNGISVSYANNGTLTNGDLNFTHDGSVIEDLISGQLDAANGTISLTSANGVVTGVVFEGRCSNEKNLRTLSVKEKRELLREQIDQGSRWAMPFTIEEIEDAAALLDFNYYNRMVDEIIRQQEVHETISIMDFLENEYYKFKDLEQDYSNLGCFAKEFVVNLSTPANFAGDPFEYVSNVIQFHIKAMIHSATNTLKLENLSFIIAGNPMVTQLITKFVSWKSSAGNNIGGITVNHSYGFATDMGANIRIVASNMYDPYTPSIHEATGQRELQLSFYGYPTDAEHISTKHVRYSQHFFNSLNQSAYQSPAAPAGAYNIVTAFSRYKTFSVQVMQMRLIITGANDIYGEPPAERVGAPWVGGDADPVV